MADRRAAPSLSFLAALLIIVCMSCLAAHFLAESLGIGLISVLAEDGGHFDDDHFLPVWLALTTGAAGLLLNKPDDPLGVKSFGLTPLLPPPNM